MTKDQKREILDQALAYAYLEISEARGDKMSTPEFRTLIKNVQELEWMRYSQLADEAQPMMPVDEEPVPVAENPEPEKTNEPVKPAPAPAPAEPTEPQFRMEEVRAALAKARGKGVNVSEIIRSFGVDNFQQIAPEQYPAIMEMLS